jgi:5-methylcytosine-specific restriction protein B
MANNKITEEHVKDVYKKFKDYYLSNKEDFFENTQKHIVEDIKEVIQRENIFNWNNASLTDYINDLVYMIKGQSFARTINKFSEKYFIEKICEDFGNELCSNAKESLRLHKEYYKSITNKNSSTNDEDQSKKVSLANENGIEKNYVKNIILYGAPGVGKTHNYQKLISMIEAGKSQNEIFDSIKNSTEVIEQDQESYKKIVDEKRVEFVTFHQSYSYEDFIEGFRPNEEGNIELEDGIFKKLSIDALNQSKKVSNKKITFDEAFDILRTQYIDDELEQLSTIRGKNIIVSNFEEKFLQVKSEEGKNWFYIKKVDLEVVVNAIAEGKVSKPIDIKNLSVKKDTFSLAGYYYPIANKIVEIINKQTVDAQDEKNFYIVIDEINRGNISKIFGELITLIEEDKRDTYEVTLPYSKEKFRVPSNLFIIATMNSTDKSIATVDIALRRRFTFLKMQPKPELVQNDDAQELMIKLNEYIKQKLNEDYMLGHSYFMKVSDAQDLEFVKEYKIKPLLEEYFYADDKSADDIVKEVENKKEDIDVN